jgi:hypothetical protein
LPSAETLSPSSRRGELPNFNPAAFFTMASPVQPELDSPQARMKTPAIAGR